MEGKLWDKEEGRYLDWLEAAAYYVNCSTGRVYKFNKCTYYCGDPFTDMSDRYEVRMEESQWSVRVVTYLGLRCTE